MGTCTLREASILPTWAQEEKPTSSVKWKAPGLSPERQVRNGSRKHALAPAAAIPGARPVAAAPARWAAAGPAHAVAGRHHFRTGAAGRAHLADRAAVEMGAAAIGRLAGGRIGLFAF